MSHQGVDFVLDKRRLPGAQVEKIPNAQDLENAGVSVDELSSSFRANFMPAGMPLIAQDSPIMQNYVMQAPSSLLSPMFSNLPNIKPEALRVASEEAQKLRRKLLRGANVLIIQGGYSGKRFVYERLKELGVNITIMDGPESIWKAAAEEGLITEFAELDFTDNATVFERAMDVVLNMEQKFDAVTTYFEDAVALAARIATALGLENNPVKACDQARNKRITRQVMKEFGLPVPKFCQIMSEADIEPACEVVGFPAILKPVFGAASMGVTRVESKEDAIAAFRKVIKTMRVEEDTIWAQGTEMVLEEYYDGDEFDIDILLFEAEVVYAKVSDNWACWEPWFQEIGTNCPSSYPEDKQAELVKLACDTTLALGFKYGVFHVEVKYTTRGPRMIEVNARMGGVSVHECNLDAWGVDLVEEHMMSVLKIPIKPALPEKPLAFFAETAINAPYSGVLNSDTWLDEFKKDPRVRYIHYFKPKGSKVIGPEDGVPDWIGEIRVVSKVSVDDGCYLIRDFMKQLKVPIDPAVEGVTRDWFFPDHMHPFHGKDS
eukprot:CAMPEP_0184692272 /NCGR_PEP_ID=MMETSP0313-20130426/823_1 /TAXON_ID=2792 /ORGANISM="Porphyridium aerugineum, Strain SAG 1380-2" /LENGTH=545 /DNA_ID=CAMNT_0027150097 /DNA_START=149 /DNA_END=1786 /DNA_ORIENTATION=-